MQKICDCKILGKRQTHGDIYKYCYRVKINNESAWANSRVEHNVGDTATLYLKPSDLICGSRSLSNICFPESEVMPIAIFLQEVHIICQTQN